MNAVRDSLLAGFASMPLQPVGPLPRESERPSDKSAFDILRRSYDANGDAVVLPGAADAGHEIARDYPLRFMILGLNYAPEMISTGVYTTGMAETLAARGHEVSVIAAHPHYPAWKIADGWPKLTYRTVRPADRLRVTHCPLYVPAKPTAKTRILHYVTFALSAFPKALWRGGVDRPDIVMVVAPSLISGLTGWITARLTGAKLWLHIQDFEVEAAFAMGAIPENGRIGRAALGFERWILSKFDRVSTISQPMIEKLKQKGVPPHKISEFRNWARVSKISVVEGISPHRDELGLNTKHVAYYSGNIAAKQGLEILPLVAERLRDRSDLTFVVCGEGAFLERLKSLSAGLDNIQFYPLVPWEKMSDALGMADVHLLPQIADVADLVLPSKLTNMLASGRPVIATAETGTALADEVEGAGIVTPPGDVEALAQAIEDLLDDPERRGTLGKAARQRALERWDKTAILDQFEQDAMRLAKF